MPAPLNLSRLNDHLPEALINEIYKISTKFNITTNLRLAHFLAQCHHESGGFKVVNENLNYSADRLMIIFKKYFTPEIAAIYARKPEKIANLVYGNRNGNGDESTGDGYKYRGRGYIQLTGKNNYAKFSEFMGVDVVTNPDLLASTYPLASAAFFFNSNNLWRQCDMGTGDDAILAVTRKVNGGTNGLDDRTAQFKKFCLLLTA